MCRKIVKEEYFTFVRSGKSGARLDFKVNIVFANRRYSNKTECEVTHNEVT